MPLSYLPQKNKYRVTIELDVMDDFDPHNIEWEKVLGIEGGEEVKSYVEDLSVPDSYFS